MNFVEPNWSYIATKAYYPKCEHAYYLRNDKHQGYVPCGHCFHCKSKVKNEWITRLFCEDPYYKANEKCFITLTLDDDNVNNTSYEDVQLFLKRFRKYCSKKGIKKIKYFGAYERGEKGGRSHFHIIFFGVNPQYFKENENKTYNQINDWFSARFWDKGFVKIEKYNYKSIFYVAGYVLKKRLDEDNLHLNLRQRVINFRNKWSKNDDEAGFTRYSYYFSSQKLGLRYLLSHLSQIVKKKKISLAGKLYNLPRYFVKKIKELFDLDLYEDLKDPSKDKPLSNLFEKIDWSNIPNLTGSMDNDIIQLFFATAEEYYSDLAKVKKAELKQRLEYKRRL